MVVLAGLVFAAGKDAIQTNRLGDAAIFEQLVESIWQGKGAVSNVFAETQNLIDRRYVYEPVSVLINKPLLPPAEPERNMLDFHGYWIMFALAGLLCVLPSSLILAGVQTFCFIGLLLGAFWLVRKQTGRHLVALGFLPLLLISPNWIGGLFGQFYPDRLFVPLAFILCCMLYSNTRTAVLLPVALLVASVNERASLIGGILCICIPFCRPFEMAEFFAGRLKQLLIGAAMLLYAYLYKKFFLSNVNYDSYLPGSLHEVYARFFVVEGFTSNAITLLWLNGVLLLFAFLRPRLGLVALLCMAPNIVGNIGGAEKVGWFTHYHSYYFPVLVFAACIGFSTLFQRPEQPRWPWLALPFALVLAWWPFSKEIAQSRMISPVQMKIPFDSARELFAGRRTGHDVRQELVAAVPTGSRVSTDELGAAMLKNQAIINIFPVAAERAQFLFVPCQLIEGADPNFAGESELTPAWLAQHGFSSKPVQQFPALGRCLLARRVQ